MKDDKELNDRIKLHTRQLRNYVGQRVSNREDAEDIVQDTLLILFGMAKTLQYGGLTILGVEGVKRLKQLFKKN